MKAPLAPFAAAGRERIREVVVPKAKRREVYAQNDEIAFGIKPVFATLSCLPRASLIGFLGINVERNPRPSSRDLHKQMRGELGCLLCLLQGAARQGCVQRERRGGRIFSRHPCQARKQGTRQNAMGGHASFEHVLGGGVSQEADKGRMQETEQYDNDGHLEQICRQLKLDGRSRVKIHRTVLGPKCSWANLR